MHVLLGSYYGKLFLFTFMVESIVVELFCCENRTGDGSSVMSTIKQRSATLVRAVVQCHIRSCGDYVPPILPNLVVGVMEVKRAFGHS